MAKLFLSYSRKDAARAQGLTQWLEQQGHDVWRDEDDIAGGASFSSEIEKALSDCDAVLVLWSANSVQSAWVRDEAGFGRDAGKLIPFSLDSVEPPLGFRQLQSINLTRWRGRGEPPNIEHIERAIRAVDPEGVQSPAPMPLTARFHGTRVWRTSIIAVAILLLATAATFLWRQGRAKEAPLAIAVSPSPTANDKAMAADYADVAAADMAAFLATRFDQVTVIAPTDAIGLKSGYRLLIAANQRSAGADASLTLSGADGHSILWSKSWSEDDGSVSELRQHVSRLASVAALCLAEAKTGQDDLIQPALGVFISGCVGIDDSDWSDSELTAIFERVVKLAPKFARGWEYLAIGRSNAVASSSDPAAAAARARNAIAVARKLNPRSGLVYLAESLLTPNDHIQSLQLIEKAASVAPEEPLVQTEWSNQLKSVGRMKASIEAARRAVELDPLSPLIRANYITSLAYGGRFSRAQNEIAEARKKWPSDPQIDLADFAFQFRYGDARLANKLMASVLDYSDAQLIPYRRVISARLNPTATTIDAAVRGWDQAGQNAGRNRYLLVLGEFGRVDEVFSLLADGGFLPFVDPGLLFRPEFAAVRADPRFMPLAKRLGLTQYWMQTDKWPDFCATEKLRYDCRKAVQQS